MKLRAQIFGAEQRALWPDPEVDKTAAWGTFDTAVIWLVAFAAYWAHPGTWRRAPSHLRAFLRVMVWWPIVRAVTRNQKYPWDNKRLNLDYREAGAASRPVSRQM